jgi:hypothetical protein
MYCSKGHKIPCNGEQIDPDNKAIKAKNPMLACYICAIEASKHMPKAAKPRSRRLVVSEVHKDQQRIDVPDIFISRGNGFGVE